MITTGVLTSLGLWKLLQHRREQERKKKEEAQKKQQFQELGLPEDFDKYTTYSPNSPAFNIPRQPEKHPFLDMDYYDPELEEEYGSKPGKKKQPQTKRNKPMTGFGLPPEYRRPPLPPYLDPISLDQIKRLTRPAIRPRKKGGKRIRKTKNPFFI